MAVGIAQIKLLQGRSAANKLLTAESSKTANEAIDNIRTVASLGIEAEFLEIYEEQLYAPFMYELSNYSSLANVSMLVVNRSNMKSVVFQGGVFAVAQASVFFIYSGGFSLGAYQVTRDPSSAIYANYDDIFRYKRKDNSPNPNPNPTTPFLIFSRVIIVCLFLLSVYAAIVFTALSIGRASSFAPDAQKAQLSASRVLTLLKRKPEIDNYSTDGLKPVSS